MRVLFEWKFVVFNVSIPSNHLSVRPSVHPSVSLCLSLSVCRYREPSLPNARFSLKPRQNTPDNWFEFVSDGPNTFEYMIWDPVNYVELRPWTPVVHKTDIGWLNWRKVDLTLILALIVAITLTLTQTDVVWLNNE